MYVVAKEIQLGLSLFFWQGFVLLKLYNRREFQGNTYKVCFLWNSSNNKSGKALLPTNHI